ncbi:MAG: LacI family DNA-binding transcriptional regulator [Angelakisella sp.]
MSTIKDISKLAGVSMTTVSRVLNHDETLAVTPQVKNNIFKIAHQLRYVPPRKRKATVGQTVKIGIADWHIVRVDRPNIQIASLDCIAREIGSADNVRFFRILPGEHQCFDGIIAFGSYTEEEMEQLRTQSHAIVFVNSDKKDYAYSRIVMDFTEGLCNMLEYLITQKGYETIGYIGGIYKDGNLCIGSHRMDGLRELLEQAGKYSPDTFHVGEISRESGYLLAKEAIAHGGLAQAMLLGSDEVAEGALDAFREAGLRVPEDVAVVIYKDIETLQSKWPTYTSIRMFPEVVWRTAIQLLLDHISDTTKETMTICLPTKLQVGDSA